MSTKISRRAALKTMSASALTLLPMLSAEGADAFAALQRTGAPAAPKVFTRPQYAAVQALADAIIPADDRSPGAKHPAGGRRP